MIARVLAYRFLFQLKANAVDRLNVVGVGINGFEFFADVGNVDVDGVVLAVVAAVPNLLVEAFAGVDFFRLAHQQLENVELMRRQRQLLASERRFA